MQYGFGVDVGGTSIKLGLFSQDGTLMEKWEIPTHTEHGGERILPEIAEAIEACMQKRGLCKEQILGIGIGVPGPVDDRGNVNCCVNLNWGVFNLHDALGILTGMKVKAGNDANVAALGEHFAGGGKGSESSLLVTIGTGVGGGFVLHDQVMNGAHGVAGEIGHIVVNRDEPLYCTCGKRGCVEQYASANGIVRVTNKRLSESDTPSSLRDFPKLSCKDVFYCAEQGDSLAKDILEQTYDYLGEAIADACCILDPELVILGGGVSKAGQVLLDGIHRHYQAYMFHACKHTRFALASLGNDAGIYGGFKLILG